MAGHNQARERLIGIALVIASASIFACVDGFSKMLAETNSVAQIVWARYALALPILLATTAPSRYSLLLGTRRPGLQILRGLAPVMVSIAMVFGVRYLPLAEATVILFAAPFVVAALSVPLLGERVPASSWIAVAVGFAAVLVVARPGFSELSLYALFPLMGALFYAALQLMTRQLGAAGEPAETTLAWTLVTGIVASSPFAIYFWEPLDRMGWALMLAVGISFGVAQLTMIRGFAHAPAALLAPLSYVQIIAATIFGVIVFEVVPDAWTLLGIVMIIGSGVYVVRRRAE